MFATEESAARAAEAAGPRGVRMGAWFAAAVVLACVSSLVFRNFAMPVGLRFAVALLPAPALLGLVLAISRSRKGLDELQERMQLEAIAHAFAVACLAFIVFATFQTAGMLGPEDWFMPWLAIGGGYVYGMAAAKRRYQ